MPKEVSIRHDGCYYACYKKGNRAYCRKEDKNCTPRPLGTTTFKQYLQSLRPELRGAFELINKLVENDQRDPSLITRFVNYVKPQNYVYASPRPIPLGFPYIKQVIPIGMSDDKFRWIDLVVTDKKLTPQQVYSYELSPMTPAAEHFFKISNLVRYKIMRPDDIEEYLNALQKRQITPNMVVKDMEVMAKEYFKKRYKVANGHYSASLNVAVNLAQQLHAQADYLAHEEQEG